MLKYNAIPKVCISTVFCRLTLELTVDWHENDGTNIDSNIYWADDSNQKRLMNSTLHDAKSSLKTNF
uniref:Uncharacterized protein n=1 Tax=Caenorhabditis japonica TaxID=281687 RepID=A0A8R1ECX7_CAEJA